MSGQRRAQILVVDDNPATRYATSRILRAEGFHIIEAATGRDALRLASDRPELIILDVNLPDIDGFQVCREIRLNTQTARIPVIHLSATFVNDQAKIQGLEAGADGYLVHPVEPPVLLSAVRALIRLRLAEDALAVSEAKFKAVFEEAPNGIALLSDEMVFLEVNPAMGTTLGRSRGEIVGKHMSLFCGTGSEPIVSEMVARLNIASAWRGSMPVVHANGQQVDLDWSVSNQAVPGRHLAITLDVTERKQVEADRERLLASERAARTEAERANQVKDDFLAALSHELRSPLSAIVGWAHVLRTILSNDSVEVKAGLDAIERSARIQTRLIADLLDVSKIASGKIELEKQWINPATALQSMLAGAREDARARQVTLALSIESELDNLWWDPTRFQQVFWNLVDNAVKFSAPGQHVDLAVRQTATDTVVTIRDSGRGISPEFLPHVFERFRQERSGSTRKYGGLGLGLSIVSQLVEAHGGTVSVDSPGEGHGATFTVSMPRQSREENGSPVDAPPTIDLSSRHILVVEDDTDARALVARILRQAGANVTEVSDVEAAIAAIEHRCPDVLISDIGMPTRDGYALIRHLRSHGYPDERLPAIALTAFVRDDDRMRTMTAGYQVHLTKPIEPLRLLAIAHELATRSAGSAPAS